MFSFSSVVTPSARTSLNAVEVYKSSPRIDGLTGVRGGVAGSIFSSFQHQLRLSPIAGGTAVTGGVGTIWFTVGGLALLIGSTLLVIRARRRARSEVTGG